MRFEIRERKTVTIREAEVIIEPKIGEKEWIVRRRAIMLKGTLELILGSEGVEFSHLGWQEMSYDRICYRFTIRVPGGTSEELENFVKEEAKKLGIDI